MKEKGLTLIELLVVIAILAIILVMIVGLVGGGIGWKPEEVTITVSDKDRVTQGHGDSRESKYLIYTEEDEVFENTDSLRFRKWNSSDFQNRLKVGRRYRVLVVGKRVPILSRYRNIVEIKETLPLAAEKGNSDESQK